MLSRNLTIHRLTLLCVVFKGYTDICPGHIRYKHTGDVVTTVTAAFDRITINHALTEICDLELSGMVTHTGRSSMEISLQVAKAPAEGDSVKPEEVMITCQCTMVRLWRFNRPTESVALRLRITH